jgi:hypothetical protein
MASVEDRRFRVERERVHSFADEWGTDYELDDESDLGVTYCAPDCLESWVLAHLFRPFFSDHSMSTEMMNVGTAMSTKRRIMASNIREPFMSSPPGLVVLL